MRAPPETTREDSTAQHASPQKIHRRRLRFFICVIWCFKIHGTCTVLHTTCTVLHAPWTQGFLLRSDPHTVQYSYRKWCFYGIFTSSCFLFLNAFVHCKVLFCIVVVRHGIHPSAQHAHPSTQHAHLSAQNMHPSTRAVTLHLHYLACTPSSRYARVHACRAVCMPCRAVCMCCVEGLYRGACVCCIEGCMSGNIKAGFLGAQTLRGIKWAYSGVQTNNPSNKKGHAMKKTPQIERTPVLESEWPNKIARTAGA